MLENIRFFLLTAPPNIIAWKVWCHLFRLKIKDLHKWQQLVKNKKGIEIGGPSSIFSNSGFLPLYEVITSLDGVNFGTQTVWEGSLQEGNYFKFQNKTGFQYIAEGSYLPQIEDRSYDFVLSCNNLEHIANPVKAIYEWQRIMKKGGVLLLVLPRKESNFDHRRAVTNLQHLILDYEKNTGENDLIHLEEILSLHDLSRDRRAGNFEAFKKRSEENLNNRCLHHHVFNQELLKQMLEYTGMKVLEQYSSKTDHFVAAEKLNNN